MISDYVYIVSLVLTAIFIWLRDTTWMTTSDDTLPILVALPLFFWIGSPWELKKEQPTYSPSLIAISVVLLLAGVAFNFTLFMAIGWTVLLWSWISARMDLEKKPIIKRLLVLPILAFPWISLDFDRLGWWFRLSGAWLTAKLFAMMGYDVVQEGTNLLIDKLPISVEAACAGLNTLQSMLIAGILVDYVTISSALLYWINLPLLVLMAWLTNTLRILIICIAAIAISPEFAMGPFHKLGGWLVIMFMFALCLLIFNLEESKAPKKTG
jgi:exosortase